MKITLKDGSVFEGTAKEYAELAKLVEGIAETEECDTPNFEVGGYVVALPTADERYLYTNSEMRLGKVEEKVGDSIRIRIVAHDRAGFVDAELFYVDSEHFRKATDEEVAKFKKEYTPKEGDIVVITGNTNNSRNKVGDIGKVGKYRINGGVRVEVPSRTASEVANGNYTKFEEMRLATEEEKEKYYAELHKAEFKAGDYAKVIKKTHEFDEGNIVKISKTDAEGYTSSFDFRVDFVSVTGKTKLRGQDCGFIDAENIVKIGEEESESIAKWSAIGRKPGEFKKGDIVKALGGSGGHVDVIGEIVNPNNSSSTGTVKMKAIYTDGRMLELYSHVELIAPVESRVDRVD